MRLSLVFAVVIFLVSGCTFDLHPVPSNAVSAEQHSVALLKPLCSNISWNSDGHVRSLSLVGDNITDEHVNALRDFSQLEDLQLLSWSISDDSMKIVASLPKLTAVDVQYTKLTDHGIQHLSSSRSLQLVVLTGTSLTDEGLSSLAQIPTLSRIFVAQTSITDDGVAAFAKQRPKCSVQRDDGRSKQSR